MTRTWLTRPGRRGVVLAATGLLAVVTLGACTGDDPENSPGGTASPSAPSGSGEGTASGSTQEQLDAFLARPAATPVASADGTLVAGDTPEEVTYDVLALQATADSTFLTWRITPKDGSMNIAGTVKVGERRTTLLPEVSLLDAKAEARLFPFTWDDLKDKRRAGCACSDLPSSTDAKGTELSALYPPLTEGTTSVKLEIPGGPTLTVPVTWS